MKRFRSLVSLLLCLCVLVLCAGPAYAVDLSRKNAVEIKKEHCVINGFSTNQFSEGRPVIIFFLGSQEYFAWLRSIEFIRKLKFFDSLDVDILFITMKKSHLMYRRWEPAGRDVCEYLQEKYESAHFPIIIDSVSFGGYGGIFLIGCLREAGIPVQELNLADACNSNCVTADMIREIAAGGTKVNIWGTTAKLNISANTRAIIEELEGTENISTIVLQCRHANALNKAIYEHGLHSDLPKVSGEE